MSCNICQTKFSFFTKEVACPGCGFSCCKKCLKYKHNITDRRVKKVCGRCYYKHTPAAKLQNNFIVNMEDDCTKSLAPVDITKKLNLLENPAKPPIVMYKHTNHWDKFKKGLEPADQEIVDRLRKLKEEEKNTALSVEEIKRRLALLKDEDPEADNYSINVHQVDTRTDQQKTDDLIREYLEQLVLSSKNDHADEIQSRLRALRDGNENAEYHSNSEARTSGQIDVDDDDDSDGDDEESATEKLIAKALAEAELEKKYGMDDAEELEEMEIEGARPTDHEEKLSCVMCDQTEDLERCKGCHGDLYCSICFEDNHDDFEMQKHQRESVKKLSPD